jgi:hypothetical protein
VFKSVFRPNRRDGAQHRLFILTYYIGVSLIIFANFIQMVDLFLLKSQNKECANNIPKKYVQGQIQGVELRTIYSCLTRSPGEEESQKVFHFILIAIY